jgi:chemotaxis protein histidine kinase CheA
MSVSKPAAHEPLRVEPPTGAKSPQHHARLSAKRAESLDRLKEMFAIATLARLDSICGHLDAHSDDHRAIQDLVFPAFHDIKGQGASLGFPQLSEIGEMVCAAIRCKQSPSIEMRLALYRVMDEVRQIINNRNAETPLSQTSSSVAKCKETLRSAIESSKTQLDAT